MRTRFGSWPQPLDVLSDRILCRRGPLHIADISTAAGPHVGGLIEAVGPELDLSRQGSPNVPQAVAIEVTSSIG